MQGNKDRQSALRSQWTLSIGAGIIALCFWHTAVGDEHEKATSTGNSAPNETVVKPRGADEAEAATAGLKETLKEVEVQMTAASKLNQELEAANKEALALLSKKTVFGLGGSRDYEEELGLLGVYKLRTDIVGTNIEDDASRFRLGANTRFRFVKVIENLANDPTDDEYWIETDCSRIVISPGSCDDTVQAVPPQGRTPQASESKTKADVPPMLLSVKKKDLSQGTFRLSLAIDHGVLLVPFKYRTGDRSFSGATTIGYFLGVRSDTLLVSGTTFVSIGTSSVPVNRVDPMTMATSTEDTSALTATVGMAFSTKSNLQFSINLGIDHIGGSVGEAWEHEDDLWVSIGLGYGFLQR